MRRLAVLGGLSGMPATLPDIDPAVHLASAGVALMPAACSLVSVRWLVPSPTTAHAAEPR